MEDFDVSDEPDRDIRTLYLDTASNLLRVSRTRGRSVTGIDWSSGEGVDIEGIPEISARFRTSLTPGLESQDYHTRSLTSSQLLAKTLTDLQMAAQLLEQDETRFQFTDGVREADFLEPGDSFFVISQEEPASYRSIRRYTALTDIAGARRRLSGAVSDSLGSVMQDTEQVVRASFTGLLGLSLSQVTAAASEVTGGISGALSSSRGIEQFTQSGRQLLVEAARSATSLMDQPALESGVRQVLDWLEEVRGGRIVSVLLERVYATELTGEELHSLIESASGPLEAFSKALQALNDLSEDYNQKARISGQILRGARWVGGGLSTFFPQATLIMAILYLAIGGYGILSGADYVDSPRLKVIKRVPGVRLRVEQHFPSS